MNTGWKILLTFGVLVLFILVLALVVVFVATGFGETPGLGGGYVAVIPIKGEITSGGCGGGLLSGPVACANVDDVKDSIQEANDDWSVEAIVLDINSGGGSVVATNELSRAIRNSKKPVVAYIGEMGASGAYHAASSASKIVADRNSITGGIGVRMTLMQYYDLMSKVGVNVTTIKAGEDKDIGSPYRPMTESEREELQVIVDKTYDDFVVTVAVNRNLSEEYVRNISNGKIYIGVDAKELGLVDELGSFDDAVDIAGGFVKMKEKPKVKNIEPGKSIGDLLGGAEGSSVDVLYNIVKYLG